jgi:hypothetical protein
VAREPGSASWSGSASSRRRARSGASSPRRMPSRSRRDRLPMLDRPASSGTSQSATLRQCLVPTDRAMVRRTRSGTSAPPAPAAGAPDRSKAAAAVHRPSPREPVLPRPPRDRRVRCGPPGLSAPSLRLRRARTEPETGSRPVSTCSVTRDATAACRQGDRAAPPVGCAPRPHRQRRDDERRRGARGFVRGSRVPPPRASRKGPGSPGGGRYPPARRGCSGSGSSSSAARLEASAASPRVSAASIIAASRGCAPSEAMRRPAGGRARNPPGRESCQAGGGTQARPTTPPAVHDDAQTRHGPRRFGDRRGSTTRRACASCSARSCSAEMRSSASRANGACLTVMWMS